MQSRWQGWRLWRHALSVAAAALASILIGAAGMADAPSSTPPGAHEAPPAQGDSSAEPVAQVEVTGERAGPRLWRVSRGDHVAWLLGTLDPLPRRVSWKSREVEGVIAQAQEVLADRPSVSGIGPIMAIRLYLQYRRTEKIPDHSTLQSVLPAPLYARFSALKLRYDPHDRRIEELRPGVAALRLYERALDDSGLTSNNLIQNTVLELARKHGVRVVRTSLRLSDPRGVLTEVSEVPRAAEIGCLEATVERLETDLGPMQARAQAWALGDVDALRRLALPNQRQVCLDAAESAPHFKQLLDQVARDWDTALEASLAQNQTTLAMRPIYDLLGANGTLARLRARGYAVEGP